jgi:hypothetical protein
VARSWSSCRASCSWWAPLTWWRAAHLSTGSLRLLASLWPWSYVAGVIAWLSLLPGTVLLDFFFGVSDLDAIVAILSFTMLSAFGLLLLTIFAGFERDVERRIGLHKTSLMSR